AGRRADRGVRGKGFIDGSAQRLGVPGAAQELEVERAVHLVGPKVERETARVRQPDLADQDSATGVRVRDPPPLAIDLVDAVTVGVRVQRSGAGSRRDRGLGLLRRKFLLDVRQERVLDQDRGRVDPDAVHAAVEPESQHAEELVAYFGVVPVEVGLLWGEQVQVPLAGAAVGLGDPGPGRPAEVRDPVVRRKVAAWTAAGAEPEAGAFERARRGGKRGFEPRVLIRAVVGY